MFPWSTVEWISNVCKFSVIYWKSYQLIVIFVFFFFFFFFFFDPNFITAYQKKITNIRFGSNQMLLIFHILCNLKLDAFKFNESTFSSFSRISVFWFSFLAHKHLNQQLNFLVNFLLSSISFVWFLSIYFILWFMSFLFTSIFQMNSAFTEQNPHRFLFVCLNLLVIFFLWKFDCTLLNWSWTILMNN